MSFGYAKPTDVQQATYAGAEAGSRYLAGGTNLLDLVKYGVEEPTRLIDIRKLPLNTIEVLAQGSVRVGALATNTAVAWHPIIRKRFPVLSEAILSGATPQLRNAATVAGNMLQRTRCYYFYDTALPCNKRSPDSGCGALMGYHRKHAVIGGSDRCIAVHPSDMSVALAALDVAVNTMSLNGPRRIPFGDLHFLPGTTPHIETVLTPGELITSIEIGPADFGGRSHYRKVRDRESYDFALSSAAVAIEVIDGLISAARIALGGVATRPWRCSEAENVLIGMPPVTSAFQHAAEVALRDARPLRDNAFKVELARRTVVTAFKELTEESHTA